MRLCNAKWSTYGWLGDLLAVAGLHDGADEGLDAAHLTHGHLVALVVTRQVGQDAGGTRHNVDVVRRQQLHQHLQQAFDGVLQVVTNIRTQ